MRTPKIQEDPELKRQQLAASTEKVRTIQDRLGAETDQALRYYSSRRALVGGTGNISSITGM